MGQAVRYLFGAVAVAVAIPVASISCKSTGFREVYIAADSEGMIRKTTFSVGEPIYCIANVANGDVNAELKVSFQPITLDDGGGAQIPILPAAGEPVVVEDEAPGKVTGVLAFTYPASAQFNESGEFRTGHIQCNVSFGGETESATFDTTIGDSKDESNVPVGSCNLELLGCCTAPLPINGGVTIKSCCTADRACGFGFPGTPFCYPNPNNTVTGGQYAPGTDDPACKSNAAPTTTTTTTNEDAGNPDEDAGNPDDEEDAGDAGDDAGIDGGSDDQFVGDIVAPKRRP